MRCTGRKHLETQDHTKIHSLFNDFFLIFFGHFCRRPVLGTLGTNVGDVDGEWCWRRMTMEWMTCYVSASINTFASRHYIRPLSGLTSNDLWSINQSIFAGLCRHPQMWKTFITFFSVFFSSKRVFSVVCFIFFKRYFIRPVRTNNYIMNYLNIISCKIKIFNFFFEKHSNMLYRLFIIRFRLWNQKKEHKPYILTNYHNDSDYEWGRWLYSNSLLIIIVKWFIIIIIIIILSHFIEQSETTTAEYNYTSIIIMWIGRRSCT